ncbi:hypothetical protein, partial [Dyella sp. ASV21]|uniref:hypothetical protein n=1 Tax=Dyella sp. ASV21 TaxID=2795114 RepID=UPI001E44F13F
GRAKARAIVKLLCREDIQSDSTYQRSLISDAPSGFSLHCTRNGQTLDKSGSFWLMPRPLFNELGDLFVPLERWVHTHGRKLVKLDVAVVNVQPQPHNFLVTVRFINTGERTIRFRDPSLWSGEIFDETLGVGASYPGDEGLAVEPFLSRGIGFQLAGAARMPLGTLINQGIELGPAEARDFVYLTAPTGRTYPGTFQFGVLTHMHITVDNSPWARGAHVDFASDDHGDPKVNIARGYPSTPQELEEYETAQRKLMLKWPVQIGGKAKLEGYYRPYDTRARSDVQGRFVVRLERGQVAPDPAGQLDVSGRPLGPGSYKWLWQADIDSVVEASSRMPCPKSGRWLAKLPEGSARVGYSPNADTIVTCQRGELLPAVGYANPHEEARVRWVWLSP